MPNINFFRFAKLGHMKTMLFGRLAFIYKAFNFNEHNFYFAT